MAKKKPKAKVKLPTPKAGTPAEEPVSKPKKPKAKPAKKKRVRKAPASVVAASKQAITDVVGVPAKLKRLKGQGMKATPISESEVQLMAMYMCTVEEISAFFDLTSRQFYRRLAASLDLRQCFDRGRAQGKRLIRQKQFIVGVEQGDSAMLKWLGQNILGQSSRHTRVADVLDRGHMDDALDVAFEEIQEDVGKELRKHGILPAIETDDAGEADSPGGGDPSGASEG